MKYFVANWKANKTLEESVFWCESFLKKIKSNSNILKNIKSEEIKVIICPSFPHIQAVRSLVTKEGISVGSQDLSKVRGGKFTGETTALSLSSLIEFTLVGHSERRIFFTETEETINLKISQAIENDIQPILCVRNEKDKIDTRVNIIAYEPVKAIGTGKNEEVDKILEMKKKLRLKNQTIFLYGGSADKRNIKEYLRTGEIDGFLIGTASVNPDDFFESIESSFI